MLHSNSQSSSATPNQEAFAENRDKVKKLLETAQLRSAITEFYKVQRDFHQNMSKIVMGFSGVIATMPDDQRYLLLELLEPYKALTQNPFPAQPSDDLEKDILSVMSVMKEQQGEFKKTLSALVDSASNLAAFNTILQICRQDMTLVNNIKSAMQCQSWMHVEGMAAQPFQHLIRYEMLLGAIEKELKRAGFDPTESAMEHVLKSLEHISPEVRNFNEHKETILMLNKLERVLQNLLAKEIAAYPSIVNIESGKISRRKYIEEIMICIRTGKNHIAKGDQDIQSLDKALLSLLQDLSKSYVESAQSSSYSPSALVGTLTNYAYTGLTFFWPLSAGQTPVQDPVKELQLIIEELDTSVQQVEVIRDLQDRIHLKKNR